MARNHIIALLLTTAVGCCPCPAPVSVPAVPAEQPAPRIVQTVTISDSFRLIEVISNDGKTTILVDGKVVTRDDD